MATDPLDVEALLAQAREDGRRWNGIHPETDVGHVHLHVSDLAEAEAFYGGLLGLDVTQRGYPGALFLSAGGYHHHLGLNVWAGKGAPPPPPEAVGLLAFSLRIPDEDAWQILRDRVEASGIRIDQPGNGASESGFLVRDPAGNGVELRFENL
jgi:catechol 2,3-dioxygenase